MRCKEQLESEAVIEPWYMTEENDSEFVANFEPLQPPAFLFCNVL